VDVKVYEAEEFVDAGDLIRMGRTLLTYSSAQQPSWIKFFKERSLPIFQ